MRDSVAGGGVTASMRVVRGGRGLGDALYVRPVTDYLLRTRMRVKVLTDYPDVYRGSRVIIAPFQRVRVDVCAHYVGGKGRAGTTQWEDVCSAAGVPLLPLAFPWTVRNPAMVAGLRAQAGGRPLVLVHGGRAPMGRTDGFGMELMPVKSAFDAVLDELRSCLLVQVGKANELYRLDCEVNLNGSTSVSDVLDLGVSCDAVVAQCSFAVPLAEVFGKPLLAVWGSAHERSRELFVRQTTPYKVLSASDDRFVWDDSHPDDIRRTTRAWLTDSARANCWPEREIKCAS